MPTTIFQTSGLSLATTATAASGIRSAPISFDVAPLADNYNITTSSGTLTITKKDLVVGGAAHDFTTVYGATPENDWKASVDLSAEAGNAANATG